MKKKLVVIGLLLVAVVGLAAAHWGNGEMEEIMEEGTYSDLEQLRQELGYNVKPWVESQEDFELAQAVHESMEAYHAENGPRYGRMGGYGRMNGYAGGCPMMG
jgi:hypothetical protein